MKNKKTYDFSPLITPGIILGFLIFGSCRIFYQNLKFDKAYDRAIIQYADIDSDGKISNNEIDYFRNDIYSKILSDHGAFLVDGEEKYLNGRGVFKEDLTSWLNNYNPSEKIE